MGDNDVVRAVKTGLVRLDGGGRVKVTKGVTTAHSGNSIVANSPHLWAPLVVDYPASGGDDVQAAADASGAGLTDALRALLVGLGDRGYHVPADVDEADLPMDIVRIALNNLPPAGEAVNEESEDPGDAPGDEGGKPGDGPADEHTPEGRKVIRAWAADNDIDVHPSGKIAQDVVDQYHAAVGQE